jgi:two-component system sensor histidine kinase VicK
MESTVLQLTREAVPIRGLPERRYAEDSDFTINRSKLLSTVCHELRTPLAIIRGYTSLLLDYDSRLKNGEKREYVESIDKATSRLSELVDQILDVSRVKSGRLTLEKALTSIPEFIHEVVAEARIRATEHTIRLVLHNGLPRVRIDTKRIRQVMDNILDNAIKYSAEGTEILVSVVPQEEGLLTSVSDQGIGIPASDLERVFERLYRVEHQLTPGNKGLGLGLAICRSLVEAHGGYIWLESTEGKGSTVFFTLPLQV